MKSYPEQIIPATAEHPEIVVVRSSRRRKTVSGRRESDGRIRLMVPASSNSRDITDYLHRLIPQIIKQHEKRMAQQSERAGDDYLHERADWLLREFLPELVRPNSIKWVTNQNTRWGSATPDQGSIRISHVLQGAPEYVIDFVLHHELCHFLELNHTQRFRVLESLYPRKMEAEAFLAGFMAGQKFTRNEVR